MADRPKRSTKVKPLFHVGDRVVFRFVSSIRHGLVTEDRGALADKGMQHIYQVRVDVDPRDGDTMIFELPENELQLDPTAAAC